MCGFTIKVRCGSGVNEFFIQLLLLKNGELLSLSKKYYFNSIILCPMQ